MLLGVTVDDSLSAALAAAGVGKDLTSGGVNTDPHRLTSLVRALEALGQAGDLGP